VNDYISKAVRIVIEYCLKHDIGTLVLGYNSDFQESPDMGNENNQTFVNIPYDRLKSKLEYLCEYYGIDFVVQEESYTSKASFFDRDSIPVYDGKNHHYVFIGRRKKRGLYKTGSGMLLNADVNGALNILRKSNVVSLSALYSRGAVDTPVRIRVA